MLLEILLEILYFRDLLFLKGQRLNILGLVGHTIILSLLQLFDSAVLAWKQPQIIQYVNGCVAVSIELY